MMKQASKQNASSDSARLFSFFPPSCCPKSSLHAFLHFTSFRFYRILSLPFPPRPVVPPRAHLFQQLPRRVVDNAEARRAQQNAAKPPAHHDDDVFV